MQPAARSASPRALVDLCGLLAYAELTAFERLAHDARHAPTLTAKAALAGMAAAEFGHFRRLQEHLAGHLDADPESAMAPFTEALDRYHESTAPSSWLESLVKAYVGDGFAASFYREVAQLLPEPTRSLVLDVMADTGHADFVVEQVNRAVATDPTVAGRLALWARRLVGEALAEAQRVAAERDDLTTLLLGEDGGEAGDLVAVGHMLARVLDAHQERMAALGLAA